ncbi:serine hydrolase domain-containing protein [Bacteroidota bacterium]
MIIVLATAGCKNKNADLNTSTLEVFSDSLFQASIDSAKIAGAAIIVSQKDKILLDKAYGFASLELSAPMPDEAQFEIGSGTKQFTAAAILKLAEAKKLSLTDDFTKYIKFDTKGRFVTIKNLLNHTSGIPSYTELPEFENLSIEKHPRDSLVRLVEQKDFLFEPGEILFYNNTGYFLLGLIIEKVTGKTYEDYLKETFFDPLGMNHTCYCSNTKVIKNKVYGYTYILDGLQQKQYLDHTWPFAAGSLCSTTKDLLIWMKALHNGKVFSDSLYQYMITPDKLNDGSIPHYANGLVNFSNYGHKEIAHIGGINGFLSDTRYFPDDNLYIICLVNTAGPHGASYFADKITWKLMDKNEYTPHKIDINLHSLAGKYIGQVGRIITLEVRDIPNALIITFEGQKNGDTLQTYLGNSTWADGNSKILLKNNECKLDQIYGYYILKKEN